MCSLSPGRLPALCVWLHIATLPRYGKDMTEKKWLTRMIFLETVAGVPVSAVGVGVVFMPFTTVGCGAFHRAWWEACCVT